MKKSLLLAALLALTIAACEKKAEPVVEAPAPVVEAPAPAPVVEAPAPAAAADASATEAAPAAPAADAKPAEEKK